MSNEEDQCFPCQVLGHIACHCPNVHCFECEEYGQIVANCPDRIPPSGKPPHHHRQNSNTRHCTISTSRCHHWDKYWYSRSRSQSQPCRYRSHSCHDFHGGCSRSYHRNSGCHHRSTLCHCHCTHHFCHNTPHQRSSSHRSFLTRSRDCCRSRPHTAYKPSKRTLCKPSPSSNRTPVKPQDRKHNRVMIDYPQTDYYSTDDNSSDSKDDGGHLN